jgi:phage terminase large subunit
VDDFYKERIKSSLSGLFYKRNFLGLWCLAEGAIFDFFDEAIHVVERPPTAAEYWIAGIDYGTANPFACVLVGVNTGHYNQLGRKWWAEKEYYWDPKITGRQKTNSEFADDVVEFLEPYGVRAVYLDPSAQAFQIELQRRGLHVVHANNEVADGIQLVSQEIQRGNFVICEDCPNLIREVQGYTWDPKYAEKGIDKPLKIADHSTDSLRYVIASHKIVNYNNDPHDSTNYMQNRFRKGRF